MFNTNHKFPFLWAFVYVENYNILNCSKLFSLCNDVETMHELNKKTWIWIGNLEMKDKWHNSYINGIKRVDSSSTILHGYYK